MANVKFKAYYKKIMQAYLFTCAYICKQFLPSYLFTENWDVFLFSGFFFKLNPGLHTTDINFLNIFIIIHSVE